VLKRPAALRRNKARPLQNLMKLPVYPRGANPRIDRHIQRKPLAYCEDQVNKYGSARWVDPADPTKGIICCDFLYFGKKISPPTADQIAKLKKRLRSGLPPVEPDGCKFVPPRNADRNETLPRIQVENVVFASRSWDWTMEPATA
jgi:hypothetical protein